MKLSAFNVTGLTAQKEYPMFIASPPYQTVNSKIKPDLARAQRYVELLRNSPDASVCIRCFDENKDREPQLPPLTFVGSVKEHWQAILDAQADGYGVFVQVNPSAGGHRTEHITAVCAYFIDLDDKPLPTTWHVKPSLIVRRDDLHWQVYWFVVGQPLETYTECQKRLIDRYGSDPKPCDLPRVLRLPGTYHQKKDSKRGLTGEPVLVTIEEKGRKRERWELLREDVMAGLPELPEPERKEASAASGDPVSLEHAEKLAGYIDADADRDVWFRAAGAIRCTPVIDDPDESKRRDLVLRWSRGELDRQKRYDRKRPAGYLSDADVLKAFDSLPPKEGGVAYGTLLHLAREGGYIGAPAPSGPTMTERFAPALAKLQADEPEAEQGKPKPSRFRLIGEEEMENLPPVRWMVKGLLQEKTSVLMVGETQSYKSFMALDLALGIATGTETFGDKPAQGLTIYAALEGLYDVMGQRREAWKIARGITGRIDTFFAVPAPTLTSPEDCTEFIEQIRSHCAARPDRRMPVLIVLETLNRLLDGLSEQSSDNASTMARLCERLIAEFGCTVIVVHHKSDKDGAAEVRGSSGFRANSDSVLRVENDRDTRTAWVKVLKHKGAAEPNEPWHFQGKLVGPSLAFHPISAAEHREKIKTDDPLSKFAVGEMLKQLEAYGPEKGVTTVVLARRLLPKEEGQSEKQWMQVTDNAAKRLGERAKPGMVLEPYTHKGEGTRRATIWCLPEAD